MTALMRSCYSSLATTATNAYTMVSKALTDSPAGYAEKNFIRTQRIIAVALIALALTSAAFNPPVGAIISLPLFKVGSILIGASLIQQVIGEASGCEHGKFYRISAGVCIMLANPIFWAAGALLWDLSNSNNRAIYRRAL